MRPIKVEWFQKSFCLAQVVEKQIGRHHHLNRFIGFPDAGPVDRFEGGIGIGHSGLAYMDGAGTMIALQFQRSTMDNPYHSETGSVTPDVAGVSAIRHG